MNQTEETTMNTETRMSSNLDQIRDQQRETWDRFSAGWKKWDAMVLGWLAPFGAAMIRHAELRDGSLVLDVAPGTGEPGLSTGAPGAQEGEPVLAPPVGGPGRSTGGRRRTGAGWRPGGGAQRAPPARQACFA